MFERLGPYTLIRRLGSGGMAETWLAARQSMTGVRKFAAIKCIHSSYNDSEDYVRLFYHEGGIALRLQHPSLISTWQCEPIDGRHVMVMEYMRGVTLEQLMERLSFSGMTIPYDAAAWIAIQILDGLEYLHTLCDESGNPLHIIHRDVTPQNIFLCRDGQCRLFDFGIAQTGQEDNDIQKGMIVGKPAYMSPEQCQSGVLDGRSDDFSLATILYEMTTGIRIFARANEIQTYNAIMNSEITAPAARIHKFPALLSHIIMSALERDPARRYHSSADFANALKRFLSVRNRLEEQSELKKLLAEQFCEDFAEDDKKLSEACASLDGEAKGIEDIIAESKPVQALGETADDSSDIEFSKLPQICIIATSSASLPPVVRADAPKKATAAPARPKPPKAPQKPPKLPPRPGANNSTSEKENNNDVHKNVAHRVKKWIFGKPQTEPENS